MKSVYLTIDLEQDCPPYLSSTRGMEEGLPRLLALFVELNVKATFFCTGDMAQQFPQLIQQLVEQGHELGCHGLTHKRFDHMSESEAEHEIAMSTKILKSFTPHIVSFRAPNLRFPDKYLELLKKQGYLIDSSICRYKSPRFRKPVKKSGLWRVPASITSSLLRIPKCLVYPRIRHLQHLVLFVHPWEFVDFRRSQLRLDCRFMTGDKALQCLRSWISLLQKKDYSFATINEFSSAV